MSATALTTVIDQAPLNGTYTSRSITNVDAGGATLLDQATGQPYTQLVLNGLLSNADASAGPPDNQLRFLPQASYDGGASWVALDDPYTWTGGTGKGGAFTLPSKTVVIVPNAQGTLPTDFRVMLDTISGEVNTGAQLGLATP